MSARLLYDDAIIGLPTAIDYELTLPEPELPDWAEAGRIVTSDGPAKFRLHATCPAPQGTYKLGLQATGAWR